jgi:hypothetical protein
MGLIFRRRLRVDDDTHANLSRSGVSVSRRLGPVTVNTRGQGTLRLGVKGLAWKFRLWPRG